MREMVTLSALSTIAATALAWLLTYALHSTLLLTGAWGVTRRLGRRSLALQEAIWRCALIGGLVTASMQLAFAQVGRMPVAGGWTLASAGGAATTGAVLDAVASADPADPATPSGPATPADPANHRALPPLSPSPAWSPSGAQPAAAAAAQRSATSAAPTSIPAILANPARTAMPAITATAPRTASVRRGVVTSSIARQRWEPNRRAASPAGAPVKAAGAAVRQPAAWPVGRIVAAWLVGAFLLSAAYLRSYALLRRRLRYRPRVVGGVMLRRLARLVREAGIARPVRLTCTWRLRVPVALGGQVAEVCVPPRALFQLSDEQQDALLAHELAHLARRDPAWLLINQLMVALFFFQPLNWLARRRLRELSELICDQWAVAQTGRPLSLAACLAEVAAWSIGPRRQACLPVPGMADRPSQLAHRIRRLLDGTSLEGRAPVRREILWSALGVLAAVALVAPGISAGSTAAVPPAEAAPTVAAAASPTESAPAASAAAPAQSAVGAVAPPEVAPTVAAATAPAEPVVGAAVQQSAMRTLRGMRAMQATAAGQGGEAADSSSPDRRGAALTAIAVPGAFASLPHAVMVIAAMAQPATAPAAEANEPASGAAPTAAAPPAPPSPSRPGDAPRALAAAGEPDLETPPGAMMDPAAEGERMAAAAARLVALDKLADLSQEQLAAISKAVDQVTRELNGRLQKELNDLDRRIASVHGGLAPLADVQAKELAHLDADLAEITAHVHLSPEDMARLDAELRKLAADAPRVSREEIKRIKKEVQEEMQRHPNGGLTSAEIEHIKTDAARAVEESRAAIAQALPPAEREKILAEARRMAAQDKPDKAQAEALRHLEQERRDLARLLEKQRADLESMRRDIEREAADYRDLARRESEAHRLHPHPARAPKATPPKSAPPKAAPPKAAPPNAASPNSAPPPPAAAPSAPADSAPPGSPPR